MMHPSFVTKATQKRIFNLRLDEGFPSKSSRHAPQPKQAQQILLRLLRATTEVAVWHSNIGYGYRSPSLHCHLHLQTTRQE
jgi:hypothetical protein